MDGQPKTRDEALAQAAPIFTRIADGMEAQRLTVLATMLPERVS